MRKLFVTLLGALMLAGASAAFAQSVEPNPGSRLTQPFPVNPALTPHPGGGQPMSGLDQQELLNYRNQLESRSQEDRMSGRDLTPGGARETRGLNAELGCVNGALAR